MLKKHIQSTLMRWLYRKSVSQEWHATCNQYFPWVTVRVLQLHHVTWYSPHCNPLPPLDIGASSIHSTSSQPTSITATLIISFHLCLGVKSGLFPLAFLTKMLCTFLICPIYSTSPAHLILLDLMILPTLGEEYKLWSFSLCSSLHYLVCLFLLGPNILRTLF
jgi:hypothetical protein